jgi:hypothetical protein
MTGLNTARGARRSALLLAALLAAAPPVGAQGNVGTGPMTGTLAESEPTSGVLTVGWVKLAPGLVIRELGRDDNIFNEPEEVEHDEDFVAAVTPDVSMFSRLRFAKVSGYAGVDLNYFQKFESERSVGYLTRGRVDVLLSRLRPFVGVGRNQTRTRPNGEIDARANRIEEEISGGLAYDWGPYSAVYAAAYRLGTSFENALEEGVDLGQSLNRDQYEYGGGFKTALTPLASLTLYGAFREERFRTAPLRDADSRSVNAKLTIGTEAVLSGVIIAGFTDFKAVDPLVEPYQGLAGSVGIIYPLLEVGRIGVTARRSLEFSFDVEEAYYVENSVNLSYNHRIRGAIDAEVSGSRAIFEYGFRRNSPAHRVNLDSARGSVGYNLRNRTRISLNYEYSRRQSTAFADRNYDRRRFFIGWGYPF